MVGWNTGLPQLHITQFHVVDGESTRKAPGERRGRKRKAALLVLHRAPLHIPPVTLSALLIKAMLSPGTNTSITPHSPNYESLQLDMRCLPLVLCFDYPFMHTLS